MANGGDLTAAGASIEQESPVVPPPPREIPTAPNRVNLTAENQSLLNSVRSATTLTRQERNTLFNLMTSNDEDGAAQFREVISRLDEDGSDLGKMASLLTSNVNRFVGMARNKTGCNRIQELLGKSDDVDVFFVNAILQSFSHIMTNREAYRVAFRRMLVFSEEKKTAMYNHVLHHALHLACNRRGYAVLKNIIIVWSASGNFFYRGQLLDIVALNALRLSYHAYGTHVVQHVLSLYDLRCTHNVAVSLRGHCFGLSFTKHGRYVVEKLLDTEAGGVFVVGELMRCDGESFVRLARSGFGNYVVWKALRVMRERNRTDELWSLVYKLMPYLHLLRGQRIGAFLDSLYY